MKPNEKANPNITRNAEEDAQFYRREITKAEAIITLKAHPGWMELKADVVEKLGDVERDLDNFERLTERDLVLRLKERKDFRWMTTVAEKVEEKLPDLHNAYADAQKKLAERNAKSGSIS